MSFEYAAGTQWATPAGFDNYSFVLQDPLLWLAAANTVAFSLAFACLQVPLALALALLVDACPRRLRASLATGFFATHLVGSAFAGLLFAAILTGRRGLLNAGLLKLGVIDVPIGWLDSTALAMPVLIGVAVYVGVGFGMIYLLAALRRVDRDLHDAAYVEGAGSLHRLWHVTLPQVRPTLAFLFVAAIFWGLQAFELPYLLFGGAGPGYRALTVVMYLFAQGFQNGDLGLASATAVVFAVVVGAVTVGLAKVLKLGGEEVRLS